MRNFGSLRATQLSNTPYPLHQDRPVCPSAKAYALYALRHGKPRRVDGTGSIVARKRPDCESVLCGAWHRSCVVASAKLHGLDPELYLRDIIRVLAFWPHERMLEIAPKYWAATRARLDAKELAAEIGELTVPPLEEKSSTG